MRVVQAGDGLGFPLEPLLQLRVAGDVLGEDFDGNRAVEAGVAGFVHLPHPAHADLGSDLIRAEAGARSEGQVADYTGLEASRRRSLLCNGQG